MTLSNRTLLSETFLQEVAAIYLDEVRGANKYNARPEPARVLSEQYKRPIGTVNRWIAKARKQGLLPAALKGKA